MRRGWEVELDDGTTLDENNNTWKEVPKIKIKRLSLLFDGRRWDISNRQAYFVKNRVSIVPGVSSSLRVEKRCIGYYEGSKKVYYVVEEATGSFSMQVTGDGES